MLLVLSSLPPTKLYTRRFMYIKVSFHQRSVIVIMVLLVVERRGNCFGFFPYDIYLLALFMVMVCIRMVAEKKNGQE